MARIYKTSDIIKINVDGLKIGVSPLTFEQKMAAQTMVMEGSVTSAMKAAAHVIRCSLKQIDGVEDHEGNPYELKFQNNMVTDECWDDLQNLEQSTKLTLVSLNLLNGIPKDFTDPNTGKPITGVSVVKSEGNKGKKK